MLSIAAPLSQQYLASLQLSSLGQLASPSLSQSPPPLSDLLKSPQTPSSVEQFSTTYPHIAALEDAQSPISTPDSPLSPSETAAQSPRSPSSSTIPQTPQSPQVPPAHLSQNALFTFSQAALWQQQLLSNMTYYNLLNSLACSPFVMSPQYQLGGASMLPFPASVPTMAKLDTLRNPFSSTVQSSEHFVGPQSPASLSPSSPASQLSPLHSPSSPDDAMSAHSSETMDGEDSESSNEAPAKVDAFSARQHTASSQLPRVSPKQST